MDLGGPTDRIIRSIQGINGAGNPVTVRDHKRTGEVN